jgi:hypothetical protein
LSLRIYLAFGYLYPEELSRLIVDVVC